MTSTPTAMAMAGATLLSGPVGKAAGTQFVHEEDKTTPNPFQTSLGQSPEVRRGEQGHWERMPGRTQAALPADRCVGSDAAVGRATPSPS